MNRAGVEADAASDALVFIYHMAASFFTGDSFLYRAYLDTFAASVAFGIDICFGPRPYHVYKAL